MAQKQGSTLIEQVVLVKRVIKKADSKFGKASIIVPFNGKDEFLGLNDGVDENLFVNGNTYKLGITVSKTGKRYVEEVIQDMGVTAGVIPEDDKLLKDSNIATNGKAYKYVDNSVGQRQGALGHYASRIVSAFVATGRIETEEQALEAFNRLVLGLDNSFGQK